jgi:recombination protein RecR
MLVEKDVDLEAVEKAGLYRGYYFVLGGTVPILDPQPENHIRFRALLNELDRQLKEGLTELIMALSLTTEGNHTADWLVEHLQPVIDKTGLKISFLGRGLSTGSELEYADAETIKNALTNRH